MPLRSIGVSRAPAIHQLQHLAAMGHNYLRLAAMALCCGCGSVSFSRVVVGHDRSIIVIITDMS